jgi:hypothetical protein
MIEDQGLMSGSRRCFTLGPFHSSEDKDEVRLLLQEVSTRTAERRTEALVEKGYWVFMPPYASMLEANEELLSLQALGLEDIGIIYDGDWKNAISLGYFLRQENALRRKKALQERGYEPLMRVQRQTEPRFWLDYEQRPGSDLIALDMTNRSNDFLQRSVPCPEQDVAEAVETEPQAPVEVVAQRQEPEAESATAADQKEGSTTPETIDNVQQEGVEEKPVQTTENVVEEVTEDSQDTPTVVEQTEESEDTPTVVEQTEVSEDTPSAVEQTEVSEDTPPDLGQETGPDLGSENEPEENGEDKPAQPVGTGPADSVEEEPKQEDAPDADDAEGNGTSEG